MLNFNPSPTLNEDPTPLDFNHRRIVDLDALIARERRLPVGVDGYDLEQRVSPRHDQEEVAGAARFAVLRPIEVGDGHRAIELVYGA